MISISKKLTIIYVLLVAITLAIVVLFETNTLESGMLAENKESEA